MVSPCLAWFVWLMGFVLFLVGQARLRRVGARGLFASLYSAYKPLALRDGAFYSLTLVYAPSREIEETVFPSFSSRMRKTQAFRRFLRFLVANHIKNKVKTRIFAYFAGFFSCQKGHFDGGCAIKGSLEGGYKHRVGAAGGVRQGAT